MAAGSSCRICGNAGPHATFCVREMMLGLGEEFHYFQCQQCGCLQISDLPTDLSRYYPPVYYSISQQPLSAKGNPVRRLALVLRDRYALYSRGVVGRLLYDRFPNEALRSLSMVPGLCTQTKILDVGCGTGALLYRLRQRGFHHLLGVDPWLQNDICYPNGLIVRRQRLEEVEGTWDLVMFHHSFEHLSDPEEALNLVARLVPQGGTCLIRTPVIPCYAWQHYGVHWVQLDAPRHLLIYSRESLELLAERTGWRLEKVVFDSTEFQFWGSEQYVRGIPLLASNSYEVNPHGSVFDRRQMAAFRSMARKLNAQEQGDSAVFYLRRLAPASGNNAKVS
ncbi:MAG: class I SAM-dependent methyltransferase [Calditrichaeota bacterium]|nr:class I SAM-dependent methyltransferase [Calditrichota bacterium]